MTRKTLSVLACLALAACQQEPAPAPSGGADATALPDPISPGEAMPVEEPTVAASDLPEEAAAAAIPEEVRGRWALVPADCDVRRSDTKGLMDVRERTIKFYESLATLGVVKESSATRIRATFAYEGEGMEWSRDMVMDVQDGGKTLILREYGEDAPPGPRKYSRCP